MSPRAAHVIEGPVNWYGLWTLYRKEVWRFVKVPAQTLASPLISTLLILAVFGLALGGRDRWVGEIPFLAFLPPGLVMMAMIGAAFANTSSSLIMSKLQGNIVDLLMPPLEAGEIAFAFLMGGITRGLATGAVLIVVLQPLVELTPVHPGFVLFHAVAASAALAMIGLIGGIWAERFDHISVITHFVITPLAFLSGTFYSVDRLPGVFHALSQFNPFFYMIDGFRYGFIGHADGSLTVGIVLMLGLDVALWFVCHRMLASGYRLKP